MDTAIEREQAIFEAALEMADSSEREAFLDRSCAEQPGLRAKISKLFAAHAKADRFFDECVTAAFLTGEDTRFLAEGHEPEDPGNAPGLELGAAIGARIGNFKILQKIGEGGCGAVFLAEQEKPIRRQVAFKIIKLGMDTQAVIARFEVERQALALMDHSNIARVFDAGATETGRPYFVMELVRGVRITEYCDQHQLDTRQRLGLFIQICHAIQHAHQKGVIHRDIKPSNILVTLHDGVPVPKVIDFGIAKATHKRLTERTLSTDYGHFIGTPAYMSPEQVEISGLDVDTRSDIYSLGVLLYELLVGTPPFEQKELVGAGLDQFRRTLQEREPHRPSTKLSTYHGEQLTATALRRHTDPHRLRSDLHGDLDWIVMKALEKDRTRRYDTANGLAMDVERFLNNEPITARPPSRLYRFQKLVRRNRTTFAAGAAVGAALIVGFGTSTVLFLQERQARRRAVAAEHQQVRLRQEAERLRKQAEDRERLSQATVFLSRNEIAEADQLVAGISNPEPTLEYASVYRELGDWHGSHCQWRQAAARLAVLIQVSQPADWDTATLDYLRYGPVLVELRDRNNYERFRRLAIAHYGGTTNAVAAERVVKISLLADVNQSVTRELRPLADLAEKSLAPGHGTVETSLAAWRSFSLSLMEYRCGHYARAKVWCERSIAYQDDNLSRRANVQLVLAMSNSHLGQHTLAVAELANSRKLVEDRFKKGLEVGSGAAGFWFDWVFARILLREATSLINGTFAGH